MNSETPTERHQDVESGKDMQDASNGEDTDTCDREEDEDGIPKDRTGTKAPSRLGTAQKVRPDTADSQLNGDVASDTQSDDDDAATDRPVKSVKSPNRGNPHVGSSRTVSRAGSRSGRTSLSPLPQDTSLGTSRMAPSTPHTPLRDVVSPPMSSRAMTHIGGLCDICPQLEDPKTAKAEFICELCDQRLCVRCAKRHVETPVFAKHDVSPLTITPEDDLVELSDLHCLTHPNRTLDYFCHGCQIVACGMCVSFNHGGNEHELGRVAKLDRHKQVLLTRYEKAVRADPPPAVSRNRKQGIKSIMVAAEDRPNARLLWKRECVRGDHTEGGEEDREGSVPLCGPCDLTFLPLGQVVVVDRWNKCVKFFDEEGNNAQTILHQVAPLRLCATHTGRIAVVDDYGGGQIWILSSEQLAKKTNTDFEKEKDMSPDESPPMETGVTGLSQERDGVSLDTDGLPEEETDHDKDKSDSMKTKEGNSDNKENMAKTGDVNQQSSHQGSKSREDGRQSLTNETGTSTNSPLGANRNDATCPLTNLRVLKNWKPENIRRPWAISVNKNGQWLVSEYEQYTHASVSIYHADGGLVKTFGGHGEHDDQFDWPSYLTSDSRGRIIVSDYWNHAIKIFDHRGKFVTKVGNGWGKKDGSLTFPKGVCVDCDDYILVVDSGNSRICEFTPDGEFMRNVLTRADGIVDPEGIAFVEVGNTQEKDYTESGASQLTPGSTNQKPGKRDRLTPDQSAGNVGECRLALSLCKGRAYSAILVYSMDNVGKGINKRLQ